MTAYTVPEVSNLLKIHPDTVKNEIKRNKLKGFKVGTDWRITEQALEDYMGVVANNYKTEAEARLESENKALKKQLEDAQIKLLKISRIFIEPQLQEV